MPRAEQGLVHIVRDFLDAHQLMERLFARPTAELRFEDLQELVGDSEASVLFRLKERCHELFRGDGASTTAADREALFDLAVGSLFHEAMSFRENFYQGQVYGPRVRELRERADPDSSPLFEEFEKILGAVDGRIREGREEAFALRDQTALQLRHMLALHADNGLLARFLVEHASDAETVFGLPFEELLAKIHGSAAAGYRRAGDSYLEGGHYTAALDAYQQAAALGEQDADLDARLSFSRGLAAYLDRDYATCVTQLERWADTGAEPTPDQVRLARGAIAGALPLAEEDGAAEVTAAATALLDRLAPLQGPDAAEGRASEAQPGG
jgi:tetratricopeptide (TPR) repeat protein